MDNKPSVRDRLSQLAQHVTGLRASAAQLADSDNPVKALKQLAQIGAELSGAAAIESQLSARPGGGDRGAAGRM